MVTTLGPPGRVPHSAPARRPSRPSRHSRGAPSPTVPPRDPASAGEGKGWETPSGDQKVGLKVWCSSAPPRLLSPLQSSSRAGEAPVRSTSPAAVTSRLAIPAHLGPWPGFGTFEMPLRVERARGWLLRPSGGRGRAAESPPPAGGGEGERAGAPRGARPAAGWGQAARPPLVHLMWGVPRRFLDLSFPANHEQECWRTESRRTWLQQLHSPRNIHQLEQMLLNTSFFGHNLTLQTNSIQSLVFKLDCDFSGLSLSSATMANVSQDDSNSSLLNNYVLGAQLDHRPVNNLQKPINISFWHNQSLLSGDPVPAELQEPLEYISLVGCSISIVASLLTMLLYAHSRKQSDSITRIHMNLHGSVLLLNVTFLLSPQMALPTVPKSVCIALAATLHYALLSCLTWMAIEGYNLYLLLGHVYNVYIHRYLLKLCMLGWGFPALLVLLLLVIKSSVYGPYVISFSNSQDNGTGFQNVSMCWVCSPVVHSVLVMGYGGLMSLFNLVVLTWALWILCRLRIREKALSPWAYRDTVMVLGLTVLLGTTWVLAFFSFSVFRLPQLFLFTIFNSLYGMAAGARRAAGTGRQASHRGSLGQGVDDD
ncbi:adhesion G protein-coupled receptor G5 [Cricetulus griseus]